MHRRHFVTAGATALAAAIASRLSGAASVVAPRTRRAGGIGLHLSSVRDDLARDLDATLAAVAAIGYAEVELPSPYMARALGMRAPRELRAALDRAGLAAVATHVSTGLLYRGWERCLDAAAAHGCHYVICAPVTPEERRAARDWHELADVFDRAGAAARNSGLRFAYHNGDFEFGRAKGAVAYDVLLAETDPGLVGFELSLRGVAKAGADPLAVLDRAPRRFVAMHVAGGAAPRELGRVLAHARASGVEHFIVEREDEGGSAPLADVRRSYEQLRRLVP